MSVTRRIDEQTHDIWVAAEWDGEHQMGAYRPAVPRASALTVFWHAMVSREQFRSIVGGAEDLFQNVGRYEASVTAFGPTREPVGPISSGVTDHLAPTSPLGEYDAYRVEIKGAAGEMIVWANLANSKGEESASTVDNIGISADPKLFTGPARALIASAISQTKPLDQRVAGILLSEISEAALR
jgi:hypothetical protein